MPQVVCPKCTTKLSFPDGATGNVRCPKCQTIFQPSPPKPAFEVVEDAPPPPKVVPKTAIPVPAKPVPKPAVPTVTAKPAAPPSKRPAAQPEFEVVDDDEPAKPPTKRAAARAEANDEEKPRKKGRLFGDMKKNIKDEDEDDDRPRSKKRRDDDEDEDEKPRKKKRRDDDDDDDDDDDRPRSKRRRDDDDDDEDRPRKKKRRDDDDDEDDEDDDWAESGSKKVVGAGSAKTGMLMVSIALWISLGTFALLTLFTLIGWAGAYLPVGLMVVPGILGLAGTIVGLIGSSFCIGGPSKSRGLAIAATAVAGVHLILPFVVANNGDAGIFSERTIQLAALNSKQASDASLAEDIGKDASKAKLLEERRKDRAEFMKEYKDELMGLLFYEAVLHSKNKDEEKIVHELLDTKAPKEMRWIDTSTQLPFLDKFLAVASYHNKYFTDYLLGLLAGMVELAQLLLFVLLIGSVSKAVKGGGAIGKAKIGLIAIAAAAGIAIVLSLIGTAMRDSGEKEIEKISKGAFEGTDFSDPSSAEKKMKDLKSKVKSAMWIGRNVPTFTRFANYALFTAMLAMPAIAALQASAEAGRRARNR